MNVRIIERDGARLVECVDPLTRVEDALDLVAACMENNAERLLIDAQNLPPAFFDLRSRFAGEFVQKFQNYHIRLAMVFGADSVHSDKFEAFLEEAKCGRQFRACTNRHDAEAWLSTL